MAFGRMSQAFIFRIGSAKSWKHFPGDGKESETERETRRSFTG
jgi:hypothetical protein